MITDIPTADEFQAAGLNQIYLAWQIIIQTIVDFEQVSGTVPEYEGHDVEAASANYWQKSQPVLANSLGLIQQAMEMSLKGRIAAISPYLLIARDPKDWPSRIETAAVPFSEFRTLDAADLVKVHNTFAATPLDDEFKTFWEKVRRDRNKLMHSVSSQSFEAAFLIKTVLTAIHTLFAEVWWPERLLQMEADDKYAAYGLGGDFEHNIIMSQIDMAMKLLDPADRKRFFGFEKRRAYVCPSCWRRANRDGEEEWPKLAQLSSKAKGCTTLRCIVCVETSEVERIPCHNSDCKGDVIFEDRCLTCMWVQDEPYTFTSGLEDPKQEFGNRYSLRYQGDGRGSYCDEYFPNEEAAVEHSRRSMEAPHLHFWKSVTISAAMGFSDKAIGTWTRTKKGLTWRPKYRPSFLGPKRRRRLL